MDQEKTPVSHPRYRGHPCVRRRELLSRHELAAQNAQLARRLDAEGNAGSADPEDDERDGLTDHDRLSLLTRENEHAVAGVPASKRNLVATDAEPRSARPDFHARSADLADGELDVFTDHDRFPELPFEN